MSKEHPKYWGSLEEYEQTPEFKESLNKEFVSPPEETSFTEMERRDFLKVMGAGMLLATTACYRRPVEKIIPYVNRPEEVVPGVPNWYTSVCGECSSGCGLLVKTREGRPIKLEGNASHPLNKGGLCARGQASLLNLYDPDRLKNPLSVDQGKTKDISWDELDQTVKARLAEIKQKKGKIALLTGSLNSPATLALIQDFLAEFSGAVHVAYEGVVPEEIALAQEQSYGQKVTPRYRFDLAKMIVSFGADFLGTWLSPVEFAKGFAKARKPESGPPARFVCVESVLSLTGTNADAHFAVKPGDELAVALGLAHELAVNQKVSRYAGNAAVTEALSPYDAAAVEKQTGVPAEKLKAVADQLWKNKGSSLVVGGALKTKNGLALEVAVNLLNSILENDGVTVDASLSPSNQSQSSYADLTKLLEEMKQGRIEALLIDRSNPAYSLPLTLGFAEAVKKVPLVISLADRLDETAALGHYVAPDCHYLESWSDSNPQKGLYTIGQPAIRPLYQTRSLQDSLIAWAGLPDKSWYDYLRNHWQQKILTGGSFETLWEESLKKGFFDTLEGKREAPSGGDRSFSTGALASLKDAKGPSGDLFLGLYPSLALLDGRSANNGWLQELPDPLSKITWDNYLAVAPKLAKQMGLEEGDVVRIQGQGAQAEIPVHIQPMLHEKTVMAAVGYGRQRAGRVGNQVGINLFHFQQAAGEAVEWTGHPVSLAKTARNEKLAATQTHTSIEGRPIIQEMTFSEFEMKSGKSPAGGEEAHGEDPLPTMWSGHQYNGPYRWGMAIDMNACIGCNACMVGCQSENNIPVVGKRQVSLGREMHWIRIDRYYSGDVDQPKVNYQPMLCQHCENAPCETVCPVLATVHSDEGLNMQIYNRCVGTRYCSNNCPYKVRRFNFFDYSKQYKEPLNLVLNPDLTTRTRGVMEKCTFCIQRIQESKDKAKAQNRIVKDGEFKTACQQTCPADAITFGNINDPESLVSKMKQSPRGYHVLEDLNVKPQVTYLQKIREKETA